MANWDVATAGSVLTFDTRSVLYIKGVQLDSTHFLLFWNSYVPAGAKCGYTQVFAVDTSTWAVTTAADRLEYSDWGLYNSCFLIDSAHVVDAYNNLDNHGYVQVFTVNTSTWAVSTAAARLEFDTQTMYGSTLYPVDSNHFVNFWAGLDSDGYTQVFTVDTSTWAITTAAAALEFDTVNGTYPSCHQVDSNHFVNFWAGSGNDGFVQVFTVDTSTWAVSTAAAALEFDTVNGSFSACRQVDSNHFVDFWAGSGNDGFVQVFTVDTSTWAVSTAAARLEFDTVNGVWNSAIKIDSNHFLNTWQGGSGSAGYTQVFTVNTSTWAVSTAASRLNFDTQQSQNFFSIAIDTSHVLAFWLQSIVGVGYAQVLSVSVPATGIAIPVLTRQYRQRLT